jgi:hypothetical protein
MAFDAHKNFAMSAVVTPPSPPTTGASLTVTTGEGALFPAAPFNATVCPPGVLPSAANAEIVRVTARSGDVLTITRAQEGSVARAVAIGDLCVASITAKALQDIETTPYARTDAGNTFTVLQTLAGTYPQINFIESPQPADQRLFRLYGAEQRLIVDAAVDDSSSAIRAIQLTRSGDAFIYRDLYEKQRTTPLGHWIDRPFNAANFYGNGGMTWTVATAQTDMYSVVGKTVTWVLYVGGNLGGTAFNSVSVIPPIPSSGHYLNQLIFLIHAGSYVVGTFEAGGTAFSIFKLDHSNYTVGTSLAAYFQVCYRIP